MGRGHIRNLNTGPITRYTYIPAFRYVTHSHNGVSSPSKVGGHVSFFGANVNVMGVAKTLWGYIRSNLAIGYTKVIYTTFTRQGDRIALAGSEAGEQSMINSSYQGFIAEYNLVGTWNSMHRCCSSSTRNTVQRNSRLWIWGQAGASPWGQHPHTTLV